MKIRTVVVIMVLSSALTMSSASPIAWGTEKVMASSVYDSEYLTRTPDNMLIHTEVDMGKTYLSVQNLSRINKRYVITSSYYKDGVLKKTYDNKVIQRCTDYVRSFTNNADGGTNYDFILKEISVSKIKVQRRGTSLIISNHMGKDISFNLGYSVLENNEKVAYTKNKSITLKSGYSTQLPICHYNKARNSIVIYLTK